jgi:hypothetical protein
MTQAAAARRKTFIRRKIGKYIPRQFSSTTRYRFLLDRHRGYLARISGMPTDQQRAQIESLAQLEYAALQCEAESTLVSMRESREHRRLLLRVLADFERSLIPRPVREPAPRRVLEISDIVSEATYGRRPR